jgi:hypothetical protein
MLPGSLGVAGLGLFDLQQRTQKTVMSGGFDAHYVSSGHLLFGVAGTLRAVGFEANRLEVSGTPVSVIPQLVTSTWGVADFDVADDGTLASVRGTGRGPVISSARSSPLGNLYLQSADGTNRPERLTDTQNFQVPASVSPDGTQLVFTETRTTRDV